MQQLQVGLFVFIEQLSYRIGDFQYLEVSGIGNPLTLVMSDYSSVKLGHPLKISPDARRTWPKFFFSKTTM